MAREALETLLRQGEGQRLEYKQAAIKPGDLAETIVALANAQGGVILLGVDDSGVPVGVRDLKQANDLAQTAASGELCDPPVPLASVVIVDAADDRRVLAISVSRARLLHSTRGRFLVRRGSQNVALTTADVAERTKRWDSQAAPTLQVAGGYQSVYEVLKYDVTLTLCDAEGLLAWVERTEHIRFLQDGVVGIYHQIWGDGELDGYTVEPGVVADQFQVGPRQVILISLRQIKNRGDHLTLRIRRRVRRGWIKSEEWFETAVGHRTRSLAIRIVFPKDRPPLQASVVEVQSGVVKELEPQPSRDTRGQRVLAWGRQRPRVGESYLLRWRW